MAIPPKRDANGCQSNCLESGRLGHALLDHLLGQRSVESCEVVELGFISREALALGAQLRLKAAQLSFGKQGFDAIPAGPAVARAHSEHLSTPSGDSRGDAA